MIIILLGYDIFGYKDGASFGVSPCLNNFNRLELSNCVADNLYIDNDTTKTYSSTKDSWDFKTVMNALFNNSLSAGSLDNEGVPITQLKMMKRKANTLTWEIVALFDFEKTVKLYEYDDLIIENSVDYEYALTAVSSGVAGNSVIKSITSDFEGTFISDKNLSYKLFYNLNYSDIDNVTGDTLIETFNQYPTQISSPLDYKKSSIKAQIISDGSIASINSNGNIDKKAEKENRQNMLAFFKSKKPFLFKNSAGDFMIVSLSNIKESRNNNFEQSLMEISFDWCEISGTSIAELQKNGLALKVGD